MPAGPYDLELNQGGTFQRTFTFKDGDEVLPLGGYTIKSEIRTKESTSAPLILDLSLYMSVAEDVLTLRIPAQVMAALKPSQIGADLPGAGDNETKASWDLFLIVTGDTSEAEPVLQGSVSMDPATTQTLIPV